MYCSSLGNNEIAFQYFLHGFQLDSLHSRSFGWGIWRQWENKWRSAFLKSISPRNYYGLLFAAGLSDTILIDSAIALRPTFGAAYVRRAVERITANRTLEAKRLFEKALPLEFHTVNSLIRAANSCIELNDYGLARRYHQRIMDLDLLPRGLVMNSIAAAYLSEGDTASSDKTFIELDRRYPHASWLMQNNMATATLISGAYARRGDFDRALSVFDRNLPNSRWRLSQYSSFPGTQTAIGRLYSRKGDAVRAIAAFRKEIAEFPSGGEPYAALAEEFAALDQRDSVVKYYRIADSLGLSGARQSLDKYLHMSKLPRR
jgi:tetratricopeptide (TPR) repeat protein